MLKRFLKNNAGQVGVVFAVSALPIMVGATLAIDKHNSNTMRSDLQDAVDGAVLATVSNGALQPGERRTYAEARFHSNFPDIPAQLQFSDENGIVRMTATAQMSTTLGGIVGRDNYVLSASAAGTVNPGRTICTLALAPDGPNRVTFEDSVYFEAQNCSVQVNSTDPNAIVNTSTAVPAAKDFCVTGGGTGTFNPVLNSECTPVADPYANLPLPTPGPCLSLDKFKVIKEESSDDGLAGDPVIDVGVLDGALDVPLEVLTGSNRTLIPGNYCDGLTVDGYNITFSPGIYHFGKEIKFKNEAQAYARDVTFIVYGDKGKIKIESGAEVYMKAPSTGATAGLAIIQDLYLETPKGKGKKTAAPVRLDEPARKTNKKGKFKIMKSELKSGGRLDVIGTVYLPEQSLEVSGTSVFGARSKSTSFIAYEVHFKEYTYASISVDHQAEGLPPVSTAQRRNAKINQIV